MNKKSRIIIACAAAAVLVVVAVYTSLPAGDSGALATDDAERLEALRRASEHAEATEAPPQKFNEAPSAAPKPVESLKSGGGSQDGP